MGKNWNMKKMKSTNDRDLAKNGVYCNDLMLKTVFIILAVRKRYCRRLSANYSSVCTRATAVYQE